MKRVATTRATLGITLPLLLDAPAKTGAGGLGDISLQSKEASRRHRYLRLPSSKKEPNANRK